MPVAPYTPRSLKSHKPISWAFGATVTGIVDAEAVTQAAVLARTEKGRNPRAVAWLIDASGATKVQPDALLALSQHLGSLADLGLTQVALVVPPEDLNDFIESAVRSRVPRYPVNHADPKLRGLPRVGLQMFSSQRQALAWFDTGCR